MGQSAIDDQHLVLLACRSQLVICGIVIASVLAGLHFQLELIQGGLGLEVCENSPVFSGQEMNCPAVATSDHFIGRAAAITVLAWFEIYLAERPLAVLQCGAPFLLAVRVGAGPQPR